MRNKANKHFGLQITPEMHGKLNYIAKYEGRSMNGQVLHLIRRRNRPADGRQKQRGVLTWKRNQPSI